MNLEKWRRKEGITVTELARRLGRSIGMVSLVLRGKRRFDVEIISKIIKITNGEVGIDDLKKKASR